MTAKRKQSNNAGECTRVCVCVVWVDWVDWVGWDSLERAVKKLGKQDCHRWLRITKSMNDTLHAHAFAEK